MAKFEESIKQLEDIVSKLESGELTLDESLKSFEKGVKLAKQCRTILDKAEEKVKLILEDGAVTEFEENNQ